MQDFVPEAREPVKRQGPDRDIHEVIPERRPRESPRDRQGDPKAETVPAGGQAIQEPDARAGIAKGVKEVRPDDDLGQAFDSTGDEDPAPDRPGKIKPQ